MRNKDDKDGDDEFLDQSWTQVMCSDAPAQVSSLGLPAKMSQATTVASE